jgi:hypothetical protein
VVRLTVGRACDDIGLRRVGRRNSRRRSIVVWAWLRGASVVVGCCRWRRSVVVRARLRCRCDRTRNRSAVVHAVCATWSCSASVDGCMSVKCASFVLWSVGYWCSGGERSVVVATVSQTVGEVAEDTATASIGKGYHGKNGEKHKAAHHGGSNLLVRGAAGQSLPRSNPSVACGILPAADVHRGASLLRHGQSSSAVT